MKISVNEKIWLAVGDWIGKAKVVALRKGNYIVNIASGKDSATALKAAAKKFRELAAECTKMGKGSKDE